MIVSVYWQDTYIQERADAMENIHSTIVELGSIFRQLAEMIKEQEEQVIRSAAKQPTPRGRGVLASSVHSLSHTPFLSVMGVAYETIILLLYSVQCFYFRVQRSNCIVFILGVTMYTCTCNIIETRCNIVLLVCACRIDANVSETQSNVEAAHSELLKYFKGITSNRWLMVKIFAVVLVFFIIFIVFLT